MSTTNETSNKELNEEWNENSKTLLEWVKNDLKLLQLLQRIASFDNYVDDHRTYECSMVKLKKVLIVQRQVLKDGIWVSELRIHDESNGCHDNVWCCLFPTCCKNSLYIRNNVLHLSQWSTGLDIRQAPEFPFMQTYSNGKFREENLLFSLSELRSVLQITK